MNVIISYRKLYGLACLFDMPAISRKLRAYHVPKAQGQITNPPALVRGNGAPISQELSFHSTNKKFQTT